MNNEALKRLRDIADACAAARRFAAGKTFADYEAEEMLRAAIERKLEIVGEAFVKLEAAAPEITGTFSELRKIVGLRNRVIHGYDTVDEELIWDVVQNKLPALQEQAENLLEQG